MRRSSPAVPLQPQHILNYTIASDIQFSSSSSNSNGAMNGSSASSPFLLHSQQQQHQYLSYPLFEGPFQIIEPGSDMYIEMDSDLGLDPFDGSGVMEQQELFISENGIPQDVLEDVFGLDDDLAANGGDLLPKQYPVAEGLSMAEYEQDLVAEMEKLFPEVPNPLPSQSRLMEELVRADLPENPCYMSVQLQEEGANVSRKTNVASRDSQRGFRCVEMTDGNGASFKANYYHHQSMGQPPKSGPVAKSSIQHRRVAELLQSPPLRNLSPAMASKIESLASGNRPVTLTPVRSSSPLPSGPSRGNPSTTTIVIKTPKRTIATNSIPVEPTPPPPPSMDFPFPIATIKQEPPDEQQHQQPAVIPLEFTPIQVPVIAPTPITNKQPRKQKLQSLSQCDMVFKEAISTPNRGPSAVAAAVPRRIVPRPPRGPPANDFVTVTITDANNNSNGKSARTQASSARPVNPRDSTSPSIPPSNQSRLPSSFKKRSLVTHYRVQMMPTQKRIPGQPVESIEILDSSDEEEDSKGSSTGTATAPESETEDIPRKPKLPGNTESIQCPFCCKVFFTSHSLMLHSQSCADAVLFDKAASPQKQPSSTSSSSTRSSKKGESLLKPSTERSSTTAAAASEPTGPKAEPKQQRKRSPTPRSSMLLSIEILPSAFSIDNLLLCNVCQKTFRSQEHLDVHQKIHKTPTVCNFCKKKFYEPPRKHSCQEMKRAKLRK